MSLSGHHPHIGDKAIFKIPQIFCRYLPSLDCRPWVPWASGCGWISWVTQLCIDLPLFLLQGECLLVWDHPCLCDHLQPYHAIIWSGYIFSLHIITMKSPSFVGQMPNSVLQPKSTIFDSEFLMLCHFAAETAPYLVESPGAMSRRKPMPPSSSGCASSAAPVLAASGAALPGNS